MKKNLIATIIALWCALIPGVSAAWNIVCGISVLSFNVPNMDTKWEADSAALKAISSFYAAIASLQAVNVENLLQSSNATTKQAEVAKTSTAITSFKASNDQLAVALRKANELTSAANPADSIGKESMNLWKQLSDYNSGFIDALQNNRLPDLYRLHSAIDVTQDIGNLGMRASLLHLNQHQGHHTAGGANTKF